MANPFGITDKAMIEREKNPRASARGFSVAQWKEQGFAPANKSNTTHPPPEGSGA